MPKPIILFANYPRVTTPSLVKEVKTLQPPVSFWLVRGGDPAHFLAARKQLTPIAGDAKIGVTRVTNFVSLNRERPDDPSVGAVGFAINPQIHAFDDASMVETLPSKASQLVTRYSTCVAE